MILKKILLIMLPVILLISVLAIPPIPTEFYGTATIYDINRTPLPAGTQVNISAGAVPCGSFNIINSGYYGVLTCLGDDPYTAIDEGADDGQNIIFYLGNETAQTFGDTVWYIGEYHMVNITPYPKCGNRKCELTESCITCAEDCGLCPQNTTGNQTGGGEGNASQEETGGESGGGGGAAGGGAAGGGRQIGAGEGIGGQFVNVSVIICQEDWYCTDWRPEICPYIEIQERDCIDRNSCNTTALKPDTERSCTYLGTCYDKIVNQDETDMDCGGQVCEPCDLGKKCVFDFDCKSGFCNPLDNVCAEPTCTDNFKNQGEEEVDCGGPCPPCEHPTLEKPSTIAIFMVRGCGPFPWIFVLVASVVTLLLFFCGKQYIRHIRKSKEFRKLKKIDQLIRLYNLNRDFHSFVLIVILLEIGIALYWYYLC
jgi:hypothetical protein